MDRLDGIIKFLQSKQQPERVVTYHDPEKVARIIQTANPSWIYGEIELKAIDAVFNGKKWVLFTGNMGTGKTTLLRGCKYAFGIIENKQANFFSTAKFNLEFGKSGEDAILQNEHGYLFLDDLGTEPKFQNRYGTVTDPISTLLFLRYESKARTFCSTNLDLKALSERYGQRLTDRFREMFAVIAFEGESKR